MSSAENAAGFEGENRPLRRELVAESYEAGVERLSASVEAAATREDAWEDKISAGLAAGLGLLAADPPLARLLVEALSTARPAGKERDRALEHLAKALRPPGRDVPEETLRLLAGGLASHVSGRVLAGEAEQLPEDQDLLSVFLLTPMQAA